MHLSGFLPAHRRGLEKLTKGSFVEAIDDFRVTLRILVLETSSPINVMKPGIDEQESSNVATGLQFQLVPVSTCSSVDGVDGHLAIYNKAFLIPATLDDSTLSESWSRHIISSVTLYNMALTFHLLASRSAVRQQQYLKEAAKFYNMALCVHDNGSDQAGYSIILSMAIWNNLGILFAQLDDSIHSFECIECLKRCLRSPLRELISDEYESHIEHFYMNVVFHEISRHQFNCAGAA